MYNNSKSRVANPNQRGYIAQNQVQPMQAPVQQVQANVQPNVMQTQSTAYTTNANQPQWQNNQNAFAQEVNNQSNARGFNQPKSYNNAQGYNNCTANNNIANNNVNAVANNNSSNNVGYTPLYNGNNPYNQQAIQGANNNYGAQTLKPKFPYDKLVRRVFNAWEKGTNQCAPWSVIDFTNLKNDLKKQKPYGYIVVGAIAVVNIPYDETVRNYLRNKYSMTFCASGKFWGINVNSLNAFMSDLQALSTTGLTLDDGTFYVIPKRQPKKADTSWSSVYQGGYKPQQQTAPYNSANQQYNGYQQGYQNYQQAVAG